MEGWKDGRMDGWKDGRRLVLVKPAGLAMEGGLGIVGRAIISFVMMTGRMVGGFTLMPRTSKSSGANEDILAEVSGSLKVDISTARRLTITIPTGMVQTKWPEVSYRAISFKVS